ncbi:MAG: sigma-70 family RNA polymerase sigma factor [Phycisphaerae bacterium]|nr:sigma-70 family RNA polymerase sigma factor [Phycisphaerae bacterium]
MGQVSEADAYLLEQIRQGREDGWSGLVNRYQGRLVAFARSKLRRSGEAEDLVQETFISFLKSLDSFRGEVSLETYFFTILRRKIIDHYRGKHANVCLLQDVFDAGGCDGEEASDAAEQVAGGDPTASWYVRRDEQRDLQRESLAEALGELIDGLKRSVNFRDLQIVEMVFYSQIRNNRAAEMVGMDEKQVGLIKHRYLKQIREQVGRRLRELGLAEPAEAVHRGYSDGLLGEIWRERRLSCPKRSTLGAFLLGTLEPAWEGYVRFHVERLGCRFCRANLDDLQERTARDEESVLRQRILQSTVGFLSRPSG